MDVFYCNYELCANNFYEFYQTHQLHSPAKVEEMIQLPVDLTTKRDNFEIKLQVKLFFGRIVAMLNLCF